MGGQGSDGGPSEITQILVRMRGRGAELVDELYRVLYVRLRAIAQQQIARRNNPTLDTTDLLHEGYLKLVDQQTASWEDRRHFFSVAAMAMRQIIIDHARRRLAKKRGGELQRTDLDESRLRLDDRAAELVGIDEALERLKALEQRQAKVVELRFFGGLSIEECAEILDVAPSTIKRDWRKAKAFLYRELSEA